MPSSWLCSRIRPTHSLSLPLIACGSAMASVAFPELDAEGVVALVPEFLAVYAEELGRHSVLFDGVEAMLAALEAAGTPWGIVTNKPEYLAAQILPQLGWQDRCAVLIGGDTLAEKKPHPLPLQVAAERIGIAIADCVYVGDDERDIQAGRAVGMKTVLVNWGYIADSDDTDSWQADITIDQPLALLSHLS